MPLALPRGYHQHEIAFADDADRTAPSDQFFCASMFRALRLALREAQVLISDHSMVVQPGSAQGRLNRCWRSCVRRLDG